MPYRAMPWVHQGQVVSATGEHIILDTPAWFVWLENVTAFCYSSSRSWVRLTVRREKRRQQYYWYAYSKIDAKLHNTYLGKQSLLTQARLEQACQHLDQKARKGDLRNQLNQNFTSAL